MTSRTAARKRCAASQIRALRVASARVRRDRRAGRTLASGTSRSLAVGPLRAWLASVSQPLGRVDAAVLIIVTERISMGRRRYGELRLATDRRDFQHEALDEAADLAVYAAAGVISGWRGKRRHDRKPTPRRRLQRA
jgi:hypothetical protein